MHDISYVNIFREGERERKNIISTYNLFILLNLIIIIENKKIGMTELMTLNLKI